MAQDPEASTRGSILETFREAGFELVQFDAVTETKLRPDVLAWAADADGKLVPWAVAEIKPVQPNGRWAPEIALPALTRARNELGTRDHYVIYGTDWFQADATLRSLAQVDGPAAPAFGGQGEVVDVAFAASLMEERFRSLLGERRREPGPAPDFVWLDPPRSDGGPVDMDLGRIETAHSGPVLASSEVLFEARRRAIANIARRSAGRELFGSHPVITAAVAALASRKLDHDLLDPFCGTGSFLWAAIDEARARRLTLRSVRGIEINEGICAAARQVAGVSPIEATVALGDAFETDLGAVKVIVGAPPLGLRLRRPHQLADGTQTADSDLVAVDRALLALKPGGRAILQVGPGFTFSEKARHFRDHVANEFRVAAVIALPSGTVLGAGVGSVLMVIDRADPGETFVARLGDDWQTQMTPGGVALQAAIQHIDGSN